MKGEGHTTHIFGKVDAQGVADRFEVGTLVSLSCSCARVSGLCLTATIIKP